MESYDLHSENGYTSIRKGRKLMAEKKRRNRINQCLKEIRDIVCLSEQQHDPNFEKMEKAEILETTVDYLRNVRKITRTQQETKEIIHARFHQGFSKCAEEMLAYIRAVPGLSDNVHRQLRKHLGRRLSHVKQVAVTSSLPTVTSHEQRHYELGVAMTTSTHIHSSVNAYTNLSMCIPPDRTQTTLPASGYDGSPDRTQTTLPASGYDGSPDRTQTLPESGYGGSPVMETDAHNIRPCNASDSELCTVNVRRPVAMDSRVGAWVQTALVYSQQLQGEQGEPWRPW